MLLKIAEMSAFIGHQSFRWYGHAMRIEAESRLKRIRVIRVTEEETVCNKT